MFSWRVKLVHHLTSTQHPASNTSRQMECTSCCHDTRALALWPEKMHETCREASSFSMFHAISWPSTAARKQGHHT